MLRLKRVFTQGFKESGMPRVDSRILMLVLLAIIGVPDSGVAGMRQCASHALNREDAAAAEAAARAGPPALSAPLSPELVGTRAAPRRSLRLISRLRGTASRSGGNSS